MPVQILLILFILGSCKISIQNVNNAKKSSHKDDILETPSPEWIKYQQERFQNVDNLSSAYRNIQSLPKNSSLAKDRLNEGQTTSRQKSPEIKNSKVKNSREPFSEKTTSSAVEFPSIKGFIEFIKSIKQTWMKRSLFRIEDKIKMLHQLKDSLLKTIEKQFMILWQEDEDDEEQVDAVEGKEIGERIHGSHLRNKRGILDESSINFPPDAALISINFLTFAVFLIKLVLQVVNIIKTKHYQLSTLTMDTGVIRNG